MERWDADSAWSIGQAPVRAAAAVIDRLAGRMIPEQFAEELRAADALLETYRF